MMAPYHNFFFSCNDHEIWYSHRTLHNGNKMFCDFIILRNYDVIIHIYETHGPKVLIPVTSDFAEIWYWEIFWGANFRYQVRFYF